MDGLGVLRVGGRLNVAELRYDDAHHMILPKKHHITWPVVADVHRRSRHAGVNHVLAQARSRYWVIDGRQEVKIWDQVMWEKCIASNVNHGTTPDVETGDANEAFAKYCVDCAGPFVTKITRRLSAKRYLCLFTCPATRAVRSQRAMQISWRHLVAWWPLEEIQKKCISCNGTNFVGA